MVTSPNGCYGFVHAPLDDVSTAIERWRLSTASFGGNSARLRVEPIRGDIDAALSDLVPLVQPSSVELIWDCGSTWTAYFSNSKLGRDVRYLSQLLSCRGVDLVMHDASEHPSVRFVLHENGETERYVMVTWEGKVQFETYGSPLPFEDTSRYSNRRIRDRLTQEMVVSYARALGIDATEHGFFGHRGVIFATNDSQSTDLKRTGELDRIARRFGVRRIIRRE